MSRAEGRTRGARIGDRIRDKETGMDVQKTPPLYQKIKSYILQKIERGEWLPGARISSEAELVSKFGISRMTVNRALRELSAEGTLVRRQGKGTYVASLKPRSDFLEITSMAQEIHKSGGRYSCLVHLLREEKATPALASEMKLEPYSSVFHSVLVHKNNDVPVQLANRFINPEIAPHYLEQDFLTITPADYLLTIAPKYHAEHIVEAILPEEWIRKLLEIDDAEPCLALHRTTWVNATVATRSCFYYPGSRYSLGGRFSPAGAKGSSNRVGVFKKRKSG